MLFSIILIYIKILCDAVLKVEKTKLIDWIIFLKKLEDFRTFRLIIRLLTTSLNLDCIFSIIEIKVICWDISIS